MNKLIALLVVAAGAAVVSGFHDTRPKCTVCARVRYRLRSLRLLTVDLRLGSLKPPGIRTQVVSLPQAAIMPSTNLCGE